MFIPCVARMCHGMHLTVLWGGGGGGGARAQDLFYGVVSTAGAFCAYAISVCRGTNLCYFRLEYLHLKFQRMNVDKLYFHLNIKLYEFHAVIVAQVVTLL